MKPFTMVQSGENNAVEYQDKEGNLFIKEGGTRAWRNNNPGNLRKNTFASEQGAIGEAGGFAVFPDEESGKKALSNLLNTKTYQALTIGKAIKRYAPPIENDTTRYENNIESLTGLKSNTAMNALSANEKNRLVHTIQTLEGWKIGKTNFFTKTSKMAQKRKHENFLRKKNTEIDEAEIHDIMGSEAYQHATHPDHKVIQNKVSEWYASHYGKNPAKTDATGRMVKDSKSSSGKIHVREHTRDAGKTHVDPYDRSPPKH